MITNDVTWSVAPGITFRQWDQIDMRGPNRAYLLTIDPATPGLAIDYASSKSVRNTETVRHMLWRDHAIAGVNGDFYDIFDTGPRDRQPRPEFGGLRACEGRQARASKPPPVGRLRPAPPRSRRW